MKIYLCAELRQLAKLVKLVRARRDAKCVRIWKRGKVHTRQLAMMSKELATSSRSAQLLLWLV